jgi:ribosomal protein S18 acetylase RimI-like enzyme
MTPADVPAIARVHRAACLVAYRFMAWDHDLPEIEAWYAGKFPGWDFARIAECDSQVAGYLGAAGGLLDDLFIDPAFQRRGIGRTLVSAQLARGIRPVRLEVFEENAPARALYETFGFIVTERFFNAADGAWELRCSLG